MGSIGSGRRRTRRACVEECQRFPSSLCGRCSRGVRFVYVVPLDVALDRRLDCVTTEGEKACRQCLGLTYRRNQLHKSATLRLLEPVAYWQLRQEFNELVSAGGFSVSTPPPQEVQDQGADAVGQWFKERDARNASFDALARQLNSVPADAFARLYFGFEVERPGTRKYRSKS